MQTGNGNDVDGSGAGILLLYVWVQSAFPTDKERRGQAAIYRIGKIVVYIFFQLHPNGMHMIGDVPTFLWERRDRWGINYESLMCDLISQAVRFIIEVATGFVSDRLKMYVDPGGDARLSLFQAVVVSRIQEYTT